VTKSLAGLVAGLLLASLGMRSVPQPMGEEKPEGSNVVIELRIYRIKAGKRNDFVQLFDEKGVGAMEAVGMRILGQFTSLEDETTFVYLRAFASQVERQRQSEAFYGGRAWKEEFEKEVLAMIEDSSNVLLLRPTAGSRIR